jgi:hypothetical protein
LRINERWIREFVEAHSICPFAAGAMRGGSVARRVVLARAPEAAAVEARALAGELARDQAIEVGLVIFPSLALDVDEFDRFCQPLRTSERALVGAVFHPDARYGLGSPAQAVGFFRRAPDPTLQLVRVSALDAVRGATRGGKFLFDWSAEAWTELMRRHDKLPTSDRIARDNFELVRDKMSQLQAILDEIRSDRDRSYQRFEISGGG